MCLFGKKFVGLDIADSSIEVAMIKNSFGQIKVVSLGRVELEPGVVEKGKIKDREKLAVAVKEVMANAKPKPINVSEIYFGLPESRTFLHHFYLQNKNKKERQNFIEKELSENVPIPSNNLVYSVRVLNEEKDNSEILLCASQRDYLLEWQQFFKDLELEVKNFDVEILATFRDLFFNRPKEPVMLLDIGAATTFVGIFDQFGLHYEYVINIAGNDFTRAIVEANGGELDFSKAEAEKIKFGLNSKNKKNVTALKEQFAKIIEEIKQSIIDYKAESGKEISKVVLVGGSCQLDGLLEYFGKQLGLEVQIGKARSLNEIIPLFYIEAIGLALFGAEKKWKATDPSIQKL